MPDDPSTLSPADPDEPRLALQREGRRRFRHWGRGLLGGCKRDEFGGIGGHGQDASRQLRERAAQGPSPRQQAGKVGGKCEQPCRASPRVIASGCSNARAWGWIEPTEVGQTTSVVPSVFDDTCRRRHSVRQRNTAAATRRRCSSEKRRSRNSAAMRIPSSSAHHPVPRQFREYCQAVGQNRSASVLCSFVRSPSNAGLRRNSQ